MNRKVDEARLYLDDEESGDLELPSGVVSVRSSKDPEKTGPNEDAAAVIPVGAGSVVLAVADGVGGSPAGAEASAMTLEALQRSLAATATEELPLRSAILDAMEKANDAILKQGRRAATTLVVAEISGGQLRCYHVGDSELIVVGQRGVVKQRIIPHSPTGFAVEAGLLGEEEAVQHEQRHVIFNVIGSPDMRVDISTAIKLAPRDTVLLASDGLVDNLFVDEIIEIIRVGPVAKAADRLMAATRERMLGKQGDRPSKPDDVTIVLYRPTGPRRQRKR